MRNRFLVATLALCALVVFVGMTGPPSAASDSSPIMSVNFIASVTESAAPTADCVNYGLVVDNDVGVATAALTSNYSQCASVRPLDTTKENIALTGPRVSGPYIQVSEHVYSSLCGAVSKTVLTAHPATGRWVLRT